MDNNPWLVLNWEELHLAPLVTKLAAGTLIVCCGIDGPFSSMSFGHWAQALYAAAAL